MSGATLVVCAGDVAVVCVGRWRGLYGRRGCVFCMGGWRWSGWETVLVGMCTGTLSHVNVQERCLPCQGPPKDYRGCGEPGEYPAVFRSAPMCVSDIPLSPAETQILYQLGNLSHDVHPDAHACRLKLSLETRGTAHGARPLEAVQAVLCDTGYTIAILVAIR